MVIGLNLCPFAERVFKTNRIRYVVTAATDEKTLLVDLATQIEALVAAPIAEVETTLLIHPHVLTDFLAYNDFLDAGDRLLADRDLRGTIQIASFHPAYQFADSEPDAVENATNRSPYPMLHLLREASIDAVAGDEQELRAIPERNIATLRNLGKKKVLELLQAIQNGAGDQHE